MELLRAVLSPVLQGLLQKARAADILTGGSQDIIEKIFASSCVALLAVRLFEQSVFLLLPYDFQGRFVAAACDFLRSGGFYAVVRFSRVAEWHRATLGLGGGLLRGKKAGRTLIGDLIQLLERIVANQYIARGPKWHNSHQELWQEERRQVYHDSEKNVIEENGHEAVMHVCEGLLQLSSILGAVRSTAQDLKAILRLVATGPHWQYAVQSTLNSSLRPDGNATRQTGEYRKEANAKCKTNQSELVPSQRRLGLLERLRHPLLESLTAMASARAYIATAPKARPRAFWDFGGTGAGLELDPMRWPFKANQYAACCWVRLSALPSQNEEVFLWDFSTLDGRDGLSVYLRGKRPQKASPKGSSTLHAPDSPLRTTAEIVVHAHRGCSRPRHLPSPTTLGGNFSQNQPLTERAHMSGALERNEGAAQYHLEDHHGNDANLHVVSETRLLPGIWYHVAVRHGPSELRPVGLAGTLGSFRNRVGTALGFWSDRSSSEPSPSISEPSAPVSLARSLGYEDRQSSLVVLVNGDVKFEKENVPFPNFDHTSSPHSPLSPPSFSLNSHRVDAVHPVLCRDIDAQIGTMFIFNVAPSVAVLKRLKDATAFSSIDVFPSDKSTSIRDHIVLRNSVAAIGRDVMGGAHNTRAATARGGILSGLLAVFSPDRVIAAAFDAKYDPAVNEATMAIEVQGSHHALLVGESFAWSLSTENVRDSLATLGGIKSLFPVVSSLLHHNHIAEGQRTAARKWIRSKPHDVQVIFNLFAAFLHGHPRNQSEMVRLDGAGLLAWCLNLAAAQGTLRKCDSLVGQAVLALSSSARGHPHLEAAVHKRLLFDLRVWAQANLGVQLAILPLMVNLLRSNPVQFLPFIDTATLLDVLRDFYLTTQPNVFEAPNRTATRGYGPPIYSFHDIFSSSSGVATLSKGSKLSMGLSIVPSCSDASVEVMANASLRSQDGLNDTLKCSGIAEYSGSKNHRQNFEYNGMVYEAAATEFQLRQVVLTILRIVLETPTKAAGVSHTRDLAAYIEGNCTGGGDDTDIRFDGSNTTTAYTSCETIGVDIVGTAHSKIGAGWSTVSASLFLHKMNRGSARGFNNAIKLRIPPTPVLQDIDLNWSEAAEGPDTVGSGVSYLPREDPIVLTEYLATANVSSADGIIYDLSAELAPREERDCFSSRCISNSGPPRDCRLRWSRRLEDNIAAVLRMLASCPTKAAVHGVGCVLLDILLDPSLPNQFIKAVANELPTHCRGSWGVAALLLLKLFAEHPSEDEQLLALGLRIFGAFLHQTYSDLMQGTLSARSHIDHLHIQKLGTNSGLLRLNSKEETFAQKRLSKSKYAVRSDTLKGAYGAHHDIRFDAREDPKFRGSSIAEISDVGVIHDEEYRHNRACPSLMQSCPTSFRNDSSVMAGLLHVCGLGVEQVQPRAVTSQHEEWLREAIASRSCSIVSKKSCGNVGGHPNTGGLSETCDICATAEQLAASEVASAGISSWGETSISGGRFLFRQLSKRVRKTQCNATVLQGGMPLHSSEHHHQTEIWKRKSDGLNTDAYGALLGLIFHSDLVVSGMTRNYAQDIRKALRTKAGKPVSGEGIQVPPYDGAGYSNKSNPLLVSGQFSPHVPTSVNRRSSPIGENVDTKMGQSVEYSFLMTDFPQYETLLFVPPPLRHLTERLEDVCRAFMEESAHFGILGHRNNMRHDLSQQRLSTCISFTEKPFVVPGVRNAAALGCLLRLLPTMDIQMQDLAWCHMFHLIGRSGNLQVIVSGWHPEVTRAWLSALLSLLRRAVVQSVGPLCHEETVEGCTEVKWSDCDARSLSRRRASRGDSFNGSPSPIISSTPHDEQPPAETHESRNNELPDAFPVMEKADGHFTNVSQDRPGVNKKTSDGYETSLGSLFVGWKDGIEGVVDRRSWRLGVGSLLFGDTLAWGIWLARTETSAPRPIDNKQSIQPQSSRDKSAGPCGGGGGGGAFINSSAEQSCSSPFVLQMIRYVFGLGFLHVRSGVDYCSTQHEKSSNPLFVSNSEVPTSVEKYTALPAHDKALLKALLSRAVAALKHRVAIAMESGPRTKGTTAAAAAEAAAASAKDGAKLKLEQSTNFFLAEISGRSARFQALLELLFAVHALVLQRTSVVALKINAKAMESEGSSASLNQPSSRRSQSARRLRELGLLGAPALCNKKSGTGVEENNDPCDTDSCAARVCEYAALVNEDDTPEDADALLSLELLELWDQLLWPNKRSSFIAIMHLTKEGKEPAGPRYSDLYTSQSASNSPSSQVKGNGKARSRRSPTLITTPLRPSQASWSGSRSTCSGDVDVSHHGSSMLLSLLELSLLCLGRLHPIERAATENVVRLGYICGNWLLQLNKTQPLCANIGEYHKNSDGGVTSDPAFLSETGKEDFIRGKFGSVGEWAAVVVYHARASLSHIRRLLFTSKSMPNISLPCDSVCSSVRANKPLDIASAIQALVTANELCEVLATIWSANASLLRSMFGHSSCEELEHLVLSVPQNKSALEALQRLVRTSCATNDTKEVWSQFDYTSSWLRICKWLSLSSENQFAPDPQDSGVVLVINKLRKIEHQICSNFARKTASWAQWEYDESAAWSGETGLSFEEPEGSRQLSTDLPEMQPNTFSDDNIDDMNGMYFDRVLHAEVCTERAAILSQVRLQIAERKRRAERRRSLGMEAKYQIARWRRIVDSAASVHHWGPWNKPLVSMMHAAERGAASFNPPLARAGDGAAGTGAATAAYACEETDNSFLYTSSKGTDAGIDKQPMAWWRQSTYRDRFGRRLLLEQNVLYGDHDGASYDTYRASRRSPHNIIDSAVHGDSLHGLKLKNPKDAGEIEGMKEEGDKYDDDDDDDDDDAGGGGGDGVFDSSEEEIEDADSKERRPDQRDTVQIGGLSVASDMYRSRRSDGTRGFKDSSLKGGRSRQELHSRNAALFSAPPPMRFVSRNVQLVYLGVMVPGSVFLDEASAALVFVQDSAAVEVIQKHSTRHSHIPMHLTEAPLVFRLEMLFEMLNRRYRCENGAVELYFHDGQDIFINFCAQQQPGESNEGGGGTEAQGSSDVNTADGIIYTQSSTHHKGWKTTTPQQERKRFWAAIRARCRFNLVRLLAHHPTSRSPQRFFKLSQLMTQWRLRRISNFEYLLRLNLIAGRSFNDLAQYPVFPWIIADYTSEYLDLSGVDNESGAFRDLTKPIGALNHARLVKFLERFAEVDGDPDMTAHRFMYGTHYSSAGIVLHFLLRQEPFTTLAIDLQGGHFDVADRLFNDVATSFNGCMSSMTDVKELIPEWYFFPAAFLNNNNWNLGALQDTSDRRTHSQDGNDGQLGAKRASTIIRSKSSLQRVHHVTLPPWVKGATAAQRASEFVRLNRLALESEYVSLHLHHWVDLIFGYAQRGPKAREHCNVFHPVTYEDNVDLEVLQSDPVARDATIAQIRHFGQTPTQLLSKPHMKRLPENECLRPLCHNASAVDSMKFWMLPNHAQPQQGLRGGGDGSMSDLRPGSWFTARGPVQSVAVVNDGTLLVTIYADLTINMVSWSNYPDGSGYPFSVSHRKLKCLPEKGATKLTFASRRAAPPSAGANAVEPQGNCVRAAMHHPSMFVPCDVSAVFGCFGVCSSQGIGAGGGGASNGHDSGSTDGDGLALRRPWADNVPISKPGQGSGHGHLHLLSCGYWDGTLKCHSLDGGRVTSGEAKPEASTRGGHGGAVTVLDVGDDEMTVATGAIDGTVRLWIVNNPGAVEGIMACVANGCSSCQFYSGHCHGMSQVAGSAINAVAKEPRGGFDVPEEPGESLKYETARTLTSRPRSTRASASPELGSSGLLHCVHVLYGHETSVTAVAVSSALRLVASGSADGAMILHKSISGQFIRRIEFGTESTSSDAAERDAEGKDVSWHTGPISLLAFSDSLGFLVGYAAQKLSLCVYSVNGDFIARTSPKQMLATMVVSPVGDMLVAGGSEGTLEIYSIHNLSFLRKVNFQKEPAPITALSFGGNCQYLFIGTEAGEVWISTDPKIRLEMLDAAINKTFSGIL